MASNNSHACDLYHKGEINFQLTHFRNKIAENKFPSNFAAEVRIFSKSTDFTHLSGAFNALVVKNFDESENKFFDVFKRRASLKKRLKSGLSRHGV